MKKSVQAPKWFKLEKYEIYKTFSSKQLCQEVKLRHMQLDFINNKITENEINGIKIQWKGLLFDDFRPHLSFLETVKSILPKNKPSGTSISHEALESLIITFEELSLGENNLLKFGFVPESPARLINYSELYNRYSTSPALASAYFEIMTRAKKGETISKNEINEVYNKIPKSKHLEKGTLVKRSFCNNVDSDLIKMKDIFSNTGFLQHVPTGSKELLYLAINPQAPDDSITSNVLKLVKDYREHQGIEVDQGLIQSKPNDKRGGGVKILKTFIEQRIIQYIDLYIWALENELNLTNAWFISKIFADVPRAEPIPDSRLDQTIKPTAKKWLNPNWLNSYYLFDIESYNKMYPK